MKGLRTLTNQDKILQRDIYYTLFEINQKILERDNMESCIMYYLRKRKPHKIYCDHNCVSCIGSWLGEEVSGNG